MELRVDGRVEMERGPTIRPAVARGDPAVVLRYASEQAQSATAAPAVTAAAVTGAHRPCRRVPLLRSPLARRSRLAVTAVRR